MRHLVLVAAASWILTAAFLACSDAAVPGREGGSGELVAAELRYRAFEPRVSLDTGYAPCVEISADRSNPRGVKALPSVRCSSRADVDEAIHEVLGWPGNERVRGEVVDSESWHQRALLELLRRGPFGALPDLQRAHASEPTDVDVLVDLSVTFYQRALEENRPDLLLEALEWVELGLENAPHREELLFNRAVVLDRLELPFSAWRAWGDYLRVDGSGAWASEARERRASALEASTRRSTDFRRTLRELDQSIATRSVDSWVAENRQQVREWAEIELLAAWAEKRRSGDLGGAREDLRLCRRVAVAISRTTGDRMLLDHVEVLTRTGDPVAVMELAAAQEVFREGHQYLYESWDLNAAADRMESARKRFAQTWSPFVHWASFYRALVEYYRSHYAEARRDLASLRSELPNGRFPILEARIAWIEGLAASKMQDLQTSAEAYERAVQAFHELGETQNLASTQGLLASAESKLGRPEASWSLMLTALGHRPSIFQPNRLHALLEDATINAEREGVFRAALAFSDEHLDLLGPGAGPQMRHNAYIRRGRLLAALGRWSEAQAEFREAVGLRDSIASAELVERADADRNLELGKTVLATDPARAVTYLSIAVRSFLASGETQKLPDALGLRADAFLRLGDVDGAEQDLSDQLHLLDLTRRSLLSEPVRNAYVRHTTSAFDRMIGLQSVVRSEPQAAFDVAERSRIAVFEHWARAAADRGLIESAAARDLSETSIDAIRSRLTPGTAVLVYSVLEDRLLVWVVSERRFAETVIPVDAAALARLVEEFLDEIARPGDGYLDAARRLHHLLIEPLTPHLAGVERLLLEPDKFLAAVPFEALVDRATGRYLVEDFAVGSTPSLALFVRLTDRARAMPPRGSVLVVTGRSGVGARLPPLMETTREAGEIAASYPASDLANLHGPSNETLVQSIGRASVFHFAGHAAPAAESPLLPRLVLLDERGAIRAIEAQELIGSISEKLRLVILSACSTLEAQDVPDLATTLARPFLHAGVPAFIGSRWAADDRGSAELFAAFHSALAEGVSPASALRTGQLSLLRGDDPSLRHPRVWTAFTTIGSPFE